MYKYMLYRTFVSFINARYDNKKKEITHGTYESASTSHMGIQQI